METLEQNGFSFKNDNKDTKVMSLDKTTLTLNSSQWRHSGVFNVNFELVITKIPSFQRRPLSLSSPLFMQNISHYFTQ